MILAKKIKHHQDFSKELEQARKVAKFAVQNRDKLSTKYVSHIGLKSSISNQVLRKYGRNRKAKSVHNITLPIKGTDTKIKGKYLYIVPLKLTIPFDFSVLKVNCVEVGKEFCFVYYSIQESPEFIPSTTMGIDRNTTGHCAVAAIKETGKVLKIGKQASHIHRKYKSMRKRFQKKGLFSIVKKLSSRETDIVRDINHKASRHLVNIAVKERSLIRMEELKGINKRKVRKNFRYALNSWSHYQLKQFIEYKALLAGVPVTYVEPAYTSKCCSKCGLLGERSGKLFKCPSGHVEHADVNAAFNIAFTSEGIAQLQAERVVCKGNIGIPQMAT